MRSKTKTALLVFTRDAHEDRKRFGLGAQADQLAHKAILEHTFEVASDACRETESSLVVAYDGNVRTPDGAHSFRQAGESFEERFLNAIDETFELGYDRVVVIGGDTPSITIGLISEALSSDDTVVGPSLDGGFYLFAMTAAERRMLDGLSWGTERVLSELVGRLAEAGRRFTVLDRLVDLDDASSAHTQLALVARLVKQLLGVELSNASLQTPFDRFTFLPGRLDSKSTSPRGPPSR